MTKSKPELHSEDETTPPAPQKMSAAEVVKGVKSEAKKIEDLKAAAEPVAEILGRKPGADGPPAFDPYNYDPEAMGLDQSHIDGGHATQVLVIPCGKPGEQEWFRVHPDPAFSLPCVALLVEKSPDGLEKGLPYYVPPPLAKILQTDILVVKSMTSFQLYLMSNSLGNLKFWKIKNPGPDGKRTTWATSEIAVAEAAKKGWVKRISNGQNGYNAGHPLGTSRILKQEPDWHDMTLKEMLGVAFRDFTIDSLDHPVLQRLRGEIS